MGNSISAETRAFQVVKAVIHKWNPYGLIQSCAPDDEFDSEVRSIVRQVHRIRGANDAVHIISRVFSSSFEAHKFRPEDCKVVGEELFNSLQTNDLLQFPVR
jgi:hypothetical protein